MQQLVLAEVLADRVPTRSLEVWPWVVSVSQYQMTSRLQRR